MLCSTQCFVFYLLDILSSVDAFLEFACSDAVPGGGRNNEYALHLLHMSDGDIKEALVQLMLRQPILPPEHSLLSYEYGTTRLWSGPEMDSFVNGLNSFCKNWTCISRMVKLCCLHFMVLIIFGT